MMRIAEVLESKQILGPLFLIIGKFEKLRD